MKLSALALLFLAMSLLTGCQKPESHFRRHHDSKSYFRILNESIKPGFTVAQVQQLLGPEWTPPTSSSPVAVNQLRLQMAKQSSIQSPDHPDGVQIGDTFLFYSLDNYMRDFHLQFRNGKLINFDPVHFGAQQWEAMMNGTLTGAPASSDFPRVGTHKAPPQSPPAAPSSPSHP